MELLSNEREIESTHFSPLVGVCHQDQGFLVAHFLQFHCGVCVHNHPQEHIYQYEGGDDDVWPGLAGKNKHAGGFKERGFIV